MSLLDRTTSRRVRKLARVPVGARPWLQEIDPPRGAELEGPAGDRGTIAADINDRSEIVLPSPGGRFKGRPGNLEP